MGASTSIHRFIEFINLFMKTTNILKDTLVIMEYVLEALQKHI